jgi:uridine monophosphate synthetase
LISYDLRPLDPSINEVSEAERERLADLLFEIGAVKFGAFRIKLHETNPDAPLSPIYINLRILRSYPHALAYVAALLDKISRPLSFDLMADIPSAATPIVAVLSHYNGKPMISPRKESKSYGLGVMIDGAFEPGQKVLLIDDLVSKADSKFEALKPLEQAGLVVSDMLMVIDRQQGGSELLRQQGYDVHFAATIGQLLNRYRATKAIDEGRYREVINYLG